jgi:plastocyanin
MLIAVAVVAGCGGSGSGSSKPRNGAQPSARVDIRSFKFSPPTVTVTKGGAITWTNSDAAAHTVTAADRSFDTHTINHAKSHTLVFKSSGTFKYHCDFHPFMKGIVIVR